MTTGNPLQLLLEIRMNSLLSGALVGGILLYFAGKAGRAANVVTWMGIACVVVSGGLTLLSLVRAALHSF